MTSSVLDDTRRAPGGDVTDEPAFEARGIEYIPVAERRGGRLASIGTARSGSPRP